MNGPYYVYQHTFANGAIYVGKGKGPRARVFHTSRSKFWQATRVKHGDPEVSFVCTGCDEEMAFLVEEEWVRVLRLRGARLVNLTDGGEGISGYRYTEEQLVAFRARRAEYMQRPEVRQKYAETTRRYMAKPETKAHMAARMQERMQDPEYRAKLSERAKRVSNQPENLARRSEQMKALHANPAMKEKLRAESIKYWASSEARAAQSERRKAHMSKPEVREFYSRTRLAWVAAGNVPFMKYEGVSLIHTSGRFMRGTRQSLLRHLPELSASKLSALIHGRRASTKGWKLHVE
jgi:hypothetical protein